MNQNWIAPLLFCRAYFLLSPWQNALLQRPKLNSRRTSDKRASCTKKPFQSSHFFGSISIQRPFNFFRPLFYTKTFPLSPRVFPISRSLFTLRTNPVLSWLRNCWQILIPNRATCLRVSRASMQQQQQQHSPNQWQGNKIQRHYSPFINHSSLRRPINLARGEKLNEPIPEYVYINDASRCQFGFTRVTRAELGIEPRLALSGRVYTVCVANG